MVKNEIMTAEEARRKMMIRKRREVSVSLLKRIAGHERNGWVEGEGC